MPKKIIYLNLLSLIFSIKLYAQDWNYTCTGNDGTIHYIRSEYVSKSEGGIKIWQKVVYPKKIINKKLYTHVIEQSLVMFNCDRRQYMLFEDVEYSKEGTVLENFSFDNTKWENIPPGTMIESDLFKVCELFNK